MKAMALAIVGAEYVLRWLPRGTHQLREAGAARGNRKAAVRAGMTVIDRTGVFYNPLPDQWNLSRDMDVNYMMLAARPK